VCRYEVTTPQGLIPWLEQDRAAQTAGADIAALLNVTIAEEQQRACILDGTFIIDGSLFIRSGFGEPNAPDFVHLHSKRNGQAVPVLSGTSLAGAFRARAWRIATTLEKDGKAVTDRLFGHRRVNKEDRTPPTASRLWIEEAEVKNPLERVQSRVKIDRFTGGSYPGALFSEQPVFGRNDTRVHLQMKIVRPTDADIDADVGLLLLLLKELWTGDLPVGGGISVGRGRLRGERATLTYNNMSWTFAQGDRDTIHVEGGKADLERFVQTFVEGKDDGAGN
jgi:CRISPR/Cas system CSM-associated protein Csm3 (group 7 of RAMP superfamily)